MELLPRENWQLFPRRWGLQKVLIGTEANGQPRYEALSRGHPLDRPAETTVQWRYCGTDAVEAHTGTMSLLPIGGDYCPAVTGHGVITQADVDAVRDDGEERLADALQKIIDGDVTLPVEVTVTRRAMRGSQRLPLDLIFLGGAEELAAFSQEQRIEAAAERLLARGGTVARAP